MLRVLLCWALVGVGCQCTNRMGDNLIDGGPGAGSGGGNGGGVGGSGGGSAGGNGGGSGGTGGGAAGGNGGGSGGSGDAGWGLGEDGGCFTLSVPYGNPSWDTGSCPDAGCPGGTVCVVGFGEGSNVFGCAPVPAECSGQPRCACMGCMCGLGGCGDDSTGAGNSLSCNNGTISRRAAKDDIIYVDDQEREAIARQALGVSLARYRYKNEPPDARRRLGFIIDDQPNPSPAVLADRTHVDEYGYTSMLLATVQQQAKELAELRRRIEKLEHRE